MTEKKSNRLRRGTLLAGVALSVGLMFASEGKPVSAQGGCLVQQSCQCQGHAGFCRINDIPPKGCICFVGSGTIGSCSGFPQCFG
jgi:hypothetical protein